MATILPDIGPLVSLVGSIGFSLLGMVLPVIVETIWYWDPKNDNDKDDVVGKGDEDSGCSVDVLENGSGGGEIVIMDSNGSSDDSNGGADGNGSVKVTATVRECQWKNSTVYRRRVIRRTLRHIKNVTLLIVGVFALIGGAFYNVRDIIKTYSGDAAMSSV